MSVIGIDFGNESCYVAVARAGGIETVDNDYSLRATPSTVAFSDRQRVLGVAAKNKLVTNVKNTLWSFKRFLGRQFQDPYVAEEMKRFPFKVTQHANGGVAFQVQYLGELREFTVEQIVAMLFTKLKETTEAAIGQKVFDCVISVPSYFTDLERKALLSSAQIAGLNVLRLLNETTATALTYGIYKQDLPEIDQEPRKVIFVDCGHSALQVSACAFNKGKLKMLSSSSDNNLGGRNFDQILADHFCGEFLKKYNIRVEQNPRACIRLLAEVEKLKKQMSANATNLPLNIECLLDDKDVSSSMNRSEFESMSAGLLRRVEKTMEDCLMNSKLKLEEIHSVEIVGGSTRIPAIKSLIEKVFKKPASTTLNQDEAVARGCALQCAILSPNYKVKDFSITDVQPYAINLTWDNTPEGTLEIFPQYHSVPFSKILTVYQLEEFSVRATYNSPIPYPNHEIGTFVIKNFKSEDGLPVKLKLKARVNINGIFSICSATMYEKQEVTDVEPMEVTEGQAPEVEAMDASSQPKQDNAAANNTNDVTMNPQSSETKIENQSAPEEKEMDDGTKTENDKVVDSNNLKEGSNNSDVPSSQDQEMAENETRKGTNANAKKITFKATEVQVENITDAILIQNTAMMAEVEAKMISDDVREKERVDAKNNLEEFVYKARATIHELPNVPESEKEPLLKALDDLENWLYEDGSEETQQVYVERLESLREKVTSISNNQQQEQQQQQ